MWLVYEGGLCKQPTSHIKYRHEQPLEYLANNKNARKNKKICILTEMLHFDQEKGKLPNHHIPSHAY